MQEEHTNERSNEQKKTYLRQSKVGTDIIQSGINIIEVDIHHMRGSQTIR